MPVGMANTVSNEPLRREALRQVANGRTWSDMAREAGYVRSTGRWTSRDDTQRLKRELGITPYLNGQTGEWIFRQRNHPHVAVRLGRVLGLDPVDIGV